MHGNVFENVLELFGSADEQIKTAAAFAAGEWEREFAANEYD